MKGWRGLHNVCSRETYINLSSARPIYNGPRWQPVFFGRRCALPHQHRAPTITAYRGGATGVSHLTHLSSTRRSEADRKPESRAARTTALASTGHGWPQRAPFLARVTIVPRSVINPSADLRSVGTPLGARSGAPLGARSSTPLGRKGPSVRAPDGQRGWGREAGMGRRTALLCACFTRVVISAPTAASNLCCRAGRARPIPGVKERRYQGPGRNWGQA